MMFRRLYRGSDVLEQSGIFFSSPYVILLSMRDREQR
jgi:hypothetical protein